MKNSAGEIRAATQQVAQQGGLPAETLQAIVENNTGYRDEQSPLPKHRQTGQTKEHQLLDTGLRYLEKLGEFNGNKVLALHAFNYGDKRTRQALKEGFSQEEADTVYSTLAREQKYGGEPLTHEAMTAMSGILGKPSKDLSKVAVSAPPKPIVPQITGTEGIEDSGSVDVPPYAVIDGKNIITVESRSNDSFGDGNPKNDGIQRVMYDDRSWNVYKNGELIETIPPKQSTAAVAQPSKQIGAGISSLRAAIFGGESGGNYNIVNRGKRHGYGAAQVDLPSRTVDQVLAEQDRGDYKAAGAYQIIPSTLRAAKKAMGLTGREHFTPELQDRIFADYLAKDKRPELRNYITGKTNNIKAAHTALAKEWAAVDRGDGLSHYHGDGVNKAHIPLQQSMGALQDIRNQYQVNIKSGMSENAAYRSALLGGGTQTQDTPTSYNSYMAEQNTGQSTGPYATGTQAVSTGNPVADAINKGDFIKIERPDLTEVAKKIFQTKRKSRLPKYLSQAIKGGLI